MNITQHILRLNRNPQMDSWFHDQLEHMVDAQAFDQTPEHTLVMITDAIRKWQKSQAVTSVTVGMSGGLDSALCASLFKHAGILVHGVILPMNQEPEHTSLAVEVCDSLGIPVDIRDLTSAYNRCITDYDRVLLNLNDDTHQAALRRAHIRARLRMMALYDIAQVNQSVVVDTGNFSEYAVGLWVPHGDVGEVSPLRSLYKSWQIPELAEHMENIPHSVIHSTPTDGLGAWQTDQEHMGFSYLELDMLLMCEDLNQEWVRPVGAQAESVVNAIVHAVGSSHKQRQDHFSLIPSAHKSRFTMLNKIGKRWNP